VYTDANIVMGAELADFFFENGKYLQGSGSGRVYGTIQAFSWSKFEKKKKTRKMSPDLKFLTGHLQNIHSCYRHGDPLRYSRSTA
jgi:hypothetical protein